mgnify:CR=1 FL=1
MKKQILIGTAAALTAAVVILDGTSAATAQQTPQYEVGGFPITPYRSGPSKTRIKIKNPKAPAATRVIDETF